MSHERKRFIRFLWKWALHHFDEIEAVVYHRIGAFIDTLTECCSEESCVRWCFWNDKRLCSRAVNIPWRCCWSLVLTLFDWNVCVCVWKWGLPPIYGMYFFGKMMINHDDILSSGQTIALNMKHGMCDLSPCSVGMPRYSIILSSWFKFWRCGECFCELSPKSSKN